MDSVLLIIGGVALVVMLVLGSFMLSLYRKVGPNEAMVISGGGGLEPRIIVGGGTVILPLIQKTQLVSLELMSIDLKNTAPINTNDGTGVYLDAVIEAQIAKSESSIAAAISAFGEKDIRHIRSVISDTVSDHARAIINNTSRDNVVDNLTQLSTEIRNASASELMDLGVTLRAFRIKDLREVRTSLIAHNNATNSSAQLSAYQQAEPEGNGSLTGKIAVVTAPIANDAPGEVTYALLNGMSRRIARAKAQIYAGPIQPDSVVVITGSDEDGVFVEPWSVVHASMPQRIG
ncbi:MAG: hypothetical protein K2X93_08075 [Candidatus Obscuribacterales bacterium]|nr:hypothetical protein [Candidatus Obscuribacterales bacterium]